MKFKILSFTLLTCAITQPMFQRNLPCLSKKIKNLNIPFLSLMANALLLHSQHDMIKLGAFTPPKNIPPLDITSIKKTQEVIDHTTDQPVPVLTEFRITHDNNNSYDNFTYQHKTQSLHENFLSRQTLMLLAETISFQSKYSIKPSSKYPNIYLLNSQYRNHGDIIFLLSPHKKELLHLDNPVYTSTKNGVIISAENKKFFVDLQGNTHPFK